MRKKTLCWLTIFVGMLLTLVTACGPGNQANHNTNASTTARGENLYILDGYTTTNAGQRIVTFHPGNHSAQSSMTLPTGLFSQDHQRIYTATPQGRRTAITITNTLTGATIRSLTIDGSYSTAGQNYANAVLSADGHWLALRRLQQTGGISTIVLVDTQAGKIAKTIQLNGTFDLDAVSPDGSRIYLLERQNDAAGHYTVRLYQVDQGQLAPYPIIDKQDLDPNMVGNPLTRQISPDGSIAYTLYINTASNRAFIHILPLASDYPGARCIDLPVDPSAQLLRYYTLALSSDGATLYAANGAMGVISEINTADPNVFNNQLVKTVHFDPGKSATTDSNHTEALYHGAALSLDRNQSVLYFTGPNGIWAADTTNLAIKAHYATGQAFTSIALSADSRSLYAVHPASGMIAIDITSGQFQRIVSDPARTPWGIEWVNG